MKTPLPEILVIGAIGLVVSYGFAQSWTKANVVAYAVQSVVLSADGKIIMSVGSDTPLVSTNRGASWTLVPYTDIRNMASSADGMKLIGLDPHMAGLIYVSTNSARNWSPTSSLVKNWRACAITADGSKLFAPVNGGLIYTSTDFGTNWSSVGAASNLWTCLALSADGTKLAAGAQTGRIYLTTNSGVPLPLISSPTNSWTGIAVSADGSHLAATSGNSTYVSTNSGGDWTKCNISGSSVVSSADGSKLLVAYSPSGSCLYVSTNSGVNWTTNMPGGWWNSVAASADGSEFVAGGNGGIWFYQATPAPQIILTPTLTNLAFSWLVPSTNFGLQQSPDLIAWSSVTNAPQLNYTNLHYEVQLPATNALGFYRLATPE